jgi:hypothetical protein
MMNECLAQRDWSIVNGVSGELGIGHLEGVAFRRLGMVEKDTLQSD